MYDIETYKLMFEDVIKGTYIKIKDIEQNDAGTKYAVTYFDDGKFRLKTFDKEKVLNAVEINELLIIDDWTMPIENFPDPFIKG